MAGHILLRMAMIGVALLYAAFQLVPAPGMVAHVAMKLICFEAGRNKVSPVVAGKPGTDQ
jgi:hypothetical protein